MMANVVFVHPDSESLGVEYLMGLLRKKGYEVELVFYNVEDFSIGISRQRLHYDDLVAQVARHKPDIVAFSCMTDKFSFQHECSKFIKRFLPEAITVFGGVHPTAIPEYVLRNESIDAVAIGEAEISFPSFVEACSMNDDQVVLPDRPVKGMVFKRKGELIGKFEEGELVDLDSLPYPDKEPFYSAMGSFLQPYWIMASRGCPYSCSYCFNSQYRAMRGKSLLRHRSVRNVINELHYAKAKFDPSFVAFLDDCFIANKKWALNFCACYQDEISLPFMCTSMPQYLDKKIVYALKEAGCFLVQMGVQSTNEEEICRKILHRKSDNARIAQAIGLMNDVGILGRIDHMLGIPGDTIENQKEALLFYSKHKPNRISVFWLRYYPRTPIIETARNIGVLTDKDIEDINEGKLQSVGSVYQGGGLRDCRHLYSIAFLLNYLPLLNKYLVRFLVRSGFYKIFCIRNYFLSTILPQRIIGRLSKNDLFSQSKFRRRTVKLSRNRWRN